MDCFWKGAELAVTERLVLNCGNGVGVGAGCSGGEWGFGVALVACEVATEADWENQRSRLLHMAASCGRQEGRRRIGISGGCETPQRD
jgi:hypothetical protein